MADANPFKPSFGSRPPVLIGRRELADEARLAIIEGSGSPLRAMAITGPRGIGKTVTLQAMRDAALQEGWVPIAVTAGEQMLADLTDQTLAATSHLTGQPPSWRLTGLTAAGFGLSTERSAPEPVGWRARTEQLLDTLAERDTGLYVTIDEVHRDAPDLRYFCKSLQHFVSDGRAIAVVFAGLPAQLREMASAPGMTFIWRAERRALESVPLADVRSAFETTIAQQSRTIATENLRKMAAATGGFPYGIQLVGYHTWRAGTGRAITSNDVNQGIAVAQQRLATSVLEYSLAPLSGRDRDFLQAMTADDGDSRVADIGRRLGRSSGYVSNYRARLIEAGVIEPRGHGIVGFALPYLREYLLSQR